MPITNYMTARRKLVIASWTRPTEGNIFGKLEIDASNALRYIEHLRSTSDAHISITHLVGKAASLAMAKVPGINGRLLFGRYIPHDSVDVTYLVALEDGGNLAKAKVEQTDQKTLVTIANELSDLAKKLREGKDEQFKKSQGPIDILPTWLLRPVLWLTGWLTGSLGIGVKALGLERFPFGSLVITNVGMFGLDEGYAPQTPFARVPVWILVGAIGKKAVVVDDQIVIRPILPLMATLDHRFVDGFQVGIMANTLRESLEKPWLLDGLDAPPWADSPSN